MRKLLPIEVEKRKLAMRARAVLRLKHAEAYMEELNEVLPDAEARFDKALQQGKPTKSIDVSKAIDG